MHTKKWVNTDEDEKLENRINSKIYNKLSINNKQFGKRAAKHMEDFNLDPSNYKERNAFKRKIKSISNNPDYVIRGIDWRGYKESVVAYVSGEDVVLATKIMSLLL